jgi:hypothetical protein
MFLINTFYLDRVDNIELGGIFGASHSREFCLDRVMALNSMECSVCRFHRGLLKSSDDTELGGIVDVSY